MSGVMSGVMSVVWMVMVRMARYGRGHVSVSVPVPVPVSGQTEWVCGGRSARIPRPAAGLSVEHA